MLSSMVGMNLKAWRPSSFSIINVWLQLEWNSCANGGAGNPCSAAKLIRWSSLGGLPQWSSEAPFEPWLKFAFGRVDVKADAAVVLFFSMTGKNWTEIEERAFEYDGSSTFRFLNDLPDYAKWWNSCCTEPQISWTCHKITSLLFRYFRNPTFVQIDWDDVSWRDGPLPAQQTVTFCYSHLNFELILQVQKGNRSERAACTPDRGDS